jgi:hypothetical protein
MRRCTPHRVLENLLLLLKRDEFRSSFKPLVRAEAGMQEMPMDSGFRGNELPACAIKPQLIPL